MGQINRGNSADRPSGDALDVGVELEGHPLYQQALTHLQRGEWQEAIARLSQLSDQHPENRQVKDLLDEVRLKASLDEGTRVEAKRPSPLSNRWIRVLLLANLIVILINLILHFGRDELLAYQRQWQLYVENRRRQTAVARLLQEGQRHLAAGDYESAARSFEEVLALWPDHREAREGLSEAEKMTTLASLYEQAMAMVEEGHWEEALERLGRIAEMEPSYKDVAQQMAFVRRQIELADLFRQAEQLYQASDWQG
ncbi:MAG TPA: tetratricopeptide repeat protein, partial [Anaerolineae bacterium]|nr:tetratricopeptide repeat protein [Anaerolineae bacterium]